jgi:SNF family Na+-dependent transporter
MEILSPEYGLIFWTAFSLASFILMLMAVYSILTTDFKDKRTKLTWIIGVIFLPVVGSIIYFQSKRKLIEHV